MRELPRQLTADELGELFNGRTRFAERLAEIEHPLESARDVLRSLTEEEQVEALNAHPRIGERAAGRSGAEQGSNEDPVLLAALTRLNDAYEEKFGFRFVVFVGRRPRAEIVPVLRQRLARPREEELETGLDELVAIARDRWLRG